MERIWLNSYPDNVKHDIDITKHTSVMEFLHHTCQKFPDRPGFSNFGTTLTFSQIDKLSKDFAAFLQVELGMKKGQRLAIMLPNILQYPIALFGAMRIGVVVVNIDPLYTSHELAYQLNDSGAEAIIFLDNFGDVVEKTIPHTNIYKIVSTTVGECLNFPESILIDFVLRYVKKVVPKFNIANRYEFSNALKIGSKLNGKDAEITLDDVVFLQYTGGTTGVSKGAILTHRNIVANVLQAREWIGLNLISGQESAITALPIYHIFSITANVLTMMSLGIENILITNPRDFAGFVKFLQKTKFTIFVGVNTLFRKLLNTTGFEDIDFSHINLSFAGGMSVTEDVAKDWQRITDSTIVEAYGLTETSPAACINPLDITEFTGSIGLPISSTHIRIIDSQGKDVDIDKPGELCIKGPQVTGGYWNQPDENEKSFTSDGFFKTGDIAKIDQRGYVFIMDRIKNMILVSGFNVYPNEIENVVCQHPDIVEAAAIGIPGENTGESVKLFIVTEKSSLSEAEVKAFCKEHLAGYKRPKEVEFIAELPKTNVGKISHKTLRN